MCREHLKSCSSAHCVSMLVMEGLDVYEHTLVRALTASTTEDSPSHVGEDSKCAMPGNHLIHHKRPKRMSSAISSTAATHHALDSKCNVAPTARWSDGKCLSGSGCNLISSGCGLTSA